MTDTPLAGQLADTPFAEVAGALFQQKKTGTLTVTSPNKERQVVIYEGHPVAVLSADPKEHIARFLAAKGKISREQAGELLSVPETKEALQASPILTKEILAWGVKFRFINLAYDLFRWAEGTYSFEEGPPPRDRFLMKVPAPSLILKGTKHMPPSLLMEKVPGSHRIGAGPTGLDELGKLSDEDSAFLEGCGEGKMVREVFEGGGVEVSRARELLFAFTCLGLVTVEDVPEETAEMALAEGDMEMDGFALDEGEEEEAAMDAGGAAAAEAPFELDVPGADTGAGEQPASPGEEEESPAFGEPPPPGEEPPFATGTPAPMDDAPPADEDAPFTFSAPAPMDDSEEGAGESPGAAAVEFDTAGGEAPKLELELEPTAAAPAEEAAADDGPSFEIERHSYDEPAPEAEAAPPLDAGEPRPLDGPPSLQQDEGPSLEPPPLEAPDDGFGLPPLDGGEPPGREEAGGLPPPPWHESATDDAGDGGMSPFAPPEEEESVRPARREKPGAGKTKERRPSGPLAKVVTLVALLAAIGVVGAGAWLKWQSMSSPSEPLKPIPEADALAKGEMAEGLPVPALPTSVKKAVEAPAGKPAASPPPPAKPAAPAPKRAPAPQGGGDFYAAGSAAFDANDVDGAAAAWLAGLKSVRATHTITIVGVACQASTVRNEVKRFGKERQVFAVPRAYKDKACYRILMGLFPSESAAGAYIDQLPFSLRENLSISPLDSIR